MSDAGSPKGEPRRTPAAWEKETLEPTLRKTPERPVSFTTVSDLPIDRLYTSDDLGPTWNQRENALNARVSRSSSTSTPTHSRNTKVLASGGGSFDKHALNTIQNSPFSRTSGGAFQGTGTFCHFPSLVKNRAWSGLELNESGLSSRVTVCLRW